MYRDNPWNKKEDLSMRSTIFISAMILLTSVAGFISIIHAAEYHVSTSFQFSEKLLVAEDSGEDDTIFLAPGVYVGNFKYSPTSEKSLTIKPEPGLRTGDVIFDGKRKDRVFNFYSSIASNLQLEGITFQNGYTTANGGGIYASTLGSFVVLNCVIVNNETDHRNAYGGGLYIDAYNTISLINNTIIFNKARDHNYDYGKGGGLYIISKDVTAKISVCNNIIYGNDVIYGNGDDIYLSGNVSKEKLYHNNFQDADSSWHSTVGNINYPPQFIDEENGDYRLKPTSPCIDAGSNEIIGLPVIDKDGNMRTVNNVTDIGAYEYSPQIIHPADTNKDWKIEAFEFEAYDNAWKNGAEWPGGPNPIPVSFVTRAGYIYVQGGFYQNAGGDEPGCWILENID
jgi:hypothetical protein